MGLFDCVRVKDPLPGFEHITKSPNFQTKSFPTSQMRVLYIEGGMLYQHISMKKRNGNIYIDGIEVPNYKLVEECYELVKHAEGTILANCYKSELYDNLEEQSLVWFAFDIAAGTVTDTKYLGSKISTFKASSNSMCQAIWPNWDSSVIILPEDSKDA